MKAFVYAVGVLGIAACVGWSEPAPACTEPLTSGDVQLISEQVSSPDGSHCARNQYSRKSQRNGLNR